MLFCVLYEDNFSNTKSSILRKHCRNMSKKCYSVGVLPKYGKYFILWDIVDPLNLILTLNLTLKLTLKLTLILTLILTADSLYPIG